MTTFFLKMKQSKCDHFLVCNVEWFSCLANFTSFENENIQPLVRRVGGGGCKKTSWRLEFWNKHKKSVIALHIICLSLSPFLLTNNWCLFVFCVNDYCIIAYYCFRKLTQFDLVFIQFLTCFLLRNLVK